MAGLESVANISGLLGMWGEFSQVLPTLEQLTWCSLLCNMPICLAKPHWASYAQVVEIHRKFQHNGSGMPTPPHPTHYWSSVSYYIHELILSRWIGLLECHYTPPTLNRLEHKWGIKVTALFSVIQTNLGSEQLHYQNSNKPGTCGIFCDIWPWLVVSIVWLHHCDHWD